MACERESAVRDERGARHEQAAVSANPRWQAASQHARVVVALARCSCEIVSGLKQGARTTARLSVVKFGSRRSMREK
mgnify:FL=1